jgi:ribosomal protein L11 methyltransferase
MKPRRPPTLWEISICTVPAGEDAITEVLTNALGQPAVCSANLLTGRSRISVYVESAERPRLAQFAPVKAALAAVAREGVPSEPLRVTRVRREDWAESWKRHFPPLVIGRALLIRPSWSRRRGRAGQTVVTLDPGLSFGTGQHATTAFCLRQLVDCRRNGQRQSCLDAGTGSGILAIAAARLGYAPVQAFDFDAEAVRIARENAAANGVADQIRLRRADVTKLPRRSRQRFDVVCANLLADLLVQARDTLAARLAPAGRLVVAGILRTEFAVVERAFAEIGLQLAASRAEKEWRSGAFAWHPTWAASRQRKISVEA